MIRKIMLQTQILKQFSRHGDDVFIYVYLFTLMLLYYTLHTIAHIKQTCLGSFDKKYCIQFLCDDFFSSKIHARDKKEWFPKEKSDREIFKLVSTWPFECL